LAVTHSCTLPKQIGIVTALTIARQTVSGHRALPRSHEGATPAHLQHSPTDQSVAVALNRKAQSRWLDAHKAGEERTSVLTPRRRSCDLPPLTTITVRIGAPQQALNCGG